MKRTTVALIAAGIITTSAALIGSAASAQEATPTRSPAGTTVPNLCTGIPQRGGQTVDFGFRSTRVTLPGGGNFTILGVAPPPDMGFIVCYVEGNARVFISPTTCDEIRRENPTDNESADLLLDVIVDSCEMLATPTPSPTSAQDDGATTTPTASVGTIITPPDTGTAGLK